MAYRNLPEDARVAKLEALVASEPAVLAERTRLRYEHDEMSERVDRLALDVNGGPGGVIASIKGLFRSKRDGARLHEELAAATASLETLVSAEAIADAKLEEIAAARVELAALVANAAVSLRDAEGPVGDELRAIASAIVTADAEIAAIQSALEVGERAQIATKMIDDDGDALVAAITRRRGLAETVIDELGTSEREIVRARMQESLAHARERLLHLARELGALHRVLGEAPLLSPAQLVELVDTADVEPIERSPLAIAAVLLTKRIEAMVSTLLVERRRRETRRDELERQQRELAARSLRGATST